MTFEEFAEKVREMAAGRYSSARRKVGFNGCGNEWMAYVSAGDYGVSAVAESANGCLEKFRKRLIDCERESRDRGELGGEK